MYRDHRKGPGGPPGGATHPGGPHGLKWGGEPAPGGLLRPLGPPAPRVENPRGGGRPTWLGGQAPPLGRRSPHLDGIWRGRRPPGPLYKEGEGGLRTQAPGASLSPVTPLRLAELGEALPRSPLLPPPRHRAAGSPSTSPSPMLDQEGGYVSPNRTCVEHGGAVRSALGSSVIWITTSTTPSTPFS